MQMWCTWEPSGFVLFMENSLFSSRIPIQILTFAKEIK